MEGIHLFNKSNGDVQRILFDHQSMTFIAQGASAFFSRIKEFSVVYSGLTFIKRDDFRQLKDLKVVTLSHNSMQRIPKDVFEDLTKLEFLDLSFNQIKSVPISVFRTLTEVKAFHLHNNQIIEFNHVVFKYNLKLQDVWLQNNRIETIIMNSSELLPELHHFNLTGNVCIDKDYENISQQALEAFKQEIADKCDSQCEEKIIEVADCNEMNFELEKEIENLKKEVSKFRNFLRSKLII